MAKYIYSVSITIEGENEEQAEELSKDLLIKEISSGMIYVNELKSVD